MHTITVNVPQPDKQINIEIPDGWEWTGEFRKPQSGDRFVYTRPDKCIDYSNVNGRSRNVPAYGTGLGGAYHYEYAIVRPKWTPPKWMPEGSWLYAFDHLWFLTNKKPRDASSYSSVKESYNSSSDHEYDFQAKELAAYNNSTFTPPTHTRKVQIKHAL